MTRPPRQIGPRRRRIYLMRHGEVSYFDSLGRLIPNPDAVPLTERGRAQAEAAGFYLKGAGVARFDRVISSSLPRTIETAVHVLSAHGQRGEPEPWDDLREIRGGAAALAPQEIPAAVLELIQHTAPADARFIGGESVAEVHGRILPALHRLREDSEWDTALLVLHGLVNTAILSHALSGGREYFGRFEQSPGCINTLDMGETERDWIVRAVNHCPEPSHNATSRHHTLEVLLHQMTRRGG